MISCKEKGETKPLLEETRPKQDSTITIDYIMGKFEPRESLLFEQIESPYASRKGLYLRKETLKAFVAMWEAAKSDGITLTILSATRNFNYQKAIWEKKWGGSSMLSDGTLASIISDHEQRAIKILLYSSMPGTSRHHWGTDIDLNSFDNSWFETGQGLKIYSWLVDNGSNFGFCQVYTKKGTSRPLGYEEEKWHWSYIPLAKKLTQYAKMHLDNSMISGFEGAKTASEIDIVNKYVLGINPNCY